MRNEQTDTEASSKFWFYALSVLCLGWGAITLIDLVDVLSRPEDYPFGTELGWRYESQRNYVLIAWLELGLLGLALVSVLIFEKISRNTKTVVLLMALLVVLFGPSFLLL